MSQPATEHVFTGFLVAVPALAQGWLQVSVYASKSLFARHSQKSAASPGQRGAWARTQGQGWSARQDSRQEGEKAGGSSHLEFKTAFSVQY